MITRPTIQELFDGVVRNLEGAAQPGAGSAAGSDVHTLITPILGVMDRLSNEWSNWSALLIEDNEDIRPLVSG